MGTSSGQPYRERIQRSLSAGCHVLEWGSGDSTLWYADRLPAGASLVSMTYDSLLHERISGTLGVQDNVCLAHSPPKKVGDAAASSDRTAVAEEDLV
jgi:hypothetical protein